MSIRGVGRVAGMMPGVSRPVPAGAGLPGPFAAARPAAGARARWREAAGAVVVFVVVAAVHAAGTGCSPSLRMSMTATFAVAT